MIGIPPFTTDAASIRSLLDPAALIQAFGAYAVIGIAALVFAETGLLLGFVLPGDTLLLLAGLLSHQKGGLGVAWWVAGLAIAIVAFLGGEVGYLIGMRAGPRILAWSRSGGPLQAEVGRSLRFFDRYGGRTVLFARFVAVVRTVTPVAAGMSGMPRRRYALYNLLGATAWGLGITFAGWLLGFVPPVAVFVESYLDVIILGAVLTTLLATTVRLLRTRRALRAAGSGSVPDERASHR